MFEDYGVPVTSQQVILPHQPFHDDFLDTMRKVFDASRYFGVAGAKKNLWRVWGFLMGALLMSVQVGAIYKLVKLMAGLTAYSVGNRSFTARLAGMMFYTVTFVSLILCWKLSSSWNQFSTEWASVEKRLLMSVPGDPTLKRRMITVCCLIAAGALLEHVLSILSSIEFDTPPYLLLEVYILNSHGFILVPTDYSNWVAVPLFFVSNVATILWSLQDLLIVLISMGLTSRYHRLNQCVSKISTSDKNDTKCCKFSDTLKVYTWRKIREAYVKQALLVRKADGLVGGLILLSSAGNFYFICLQLFMGVTQGISGVLVKRLYYLVSLLWVCLRFSFVVLAAADVNVHSKKALRYLHSCDDRCYNTEKLELRSEKQSPFYVYREIYEKKIRFEPIEVLCSSNSSMFEPEKNRTYSETIRVDRLVKQLTKDYIALSGMGFFNIDRGMLLQMAAAIITYELVLIQFDGKAGTEHVELKLNVTKI